jgi:hypothetical protein
MKYPECLNGRCTYNVEYRCKAEGIGEDIICRQGKDDASSQFKETGPGDENTRDLMTGGQIQRNTDQGSFSAETE